MRGDDLPALHGLPLAVKDIFDTHDMPTEVFVTDLKTGKETKLSDFNKEINAILTDPNMKTRLAGIGVDPMPMAPAEFGKFIADETEKWGKVIRAAGIKPA